jgi:hypothetical protein
MTKQPPHPLDDCDPTDCYQTMMSERTALITARREAEDNLIKTVIQLAAALLALLAGFISQAKFELDLPSLILFGLALTLLALSIIAGLVEQRYSSEAYLDQQKLVEDYFQKKISSFEEPSANKKVRTAQFVAFVSFVGALICLGIFAITEAGENYVKVQIASTTPFQNDKSSRATNTERHQERRNSVSSTVNAAASTKEKMTVSHENVAPARKGS